MGEIMEEVKIIDLQIYAYSDDILLGIFDKKILSDKTKEAIKRDVEKHIEGEK
jgi:hypothetical protein